MGRGFPASSREVIQSQPWQLVSSRPWTTIRERNPREKKGPRGCSPEPSTPLARAPWGWCQALGRPRLPAHLLAFRAAASLNGALCVPRELAPRSPDRNAGQRCLPCIRRPSAPGPSSGGRPLSGRAAPALGAPGTCTPAQGEHGGPQGSRGLGHLL